MFVQRLMRRLRKLVASLFHLHATDPLPPERTAILTATLRGGSGTAATPNTASWLDDSRRLRPRPSPPAKLDQRWDTRSASTARPSMPPPHIGRVAPMRPAAEHPPTEAIRPQHTEPVAQQPPSPAPRRSDEMAPTPGMSADPGDQILQRRLMALKRLVRLGIYNEGFDPTRVPEQYLHSLGHEDDLGV